MRRETRKDIVAKIGLLLLEIVEQEKDLPFEFCADDELRRLASGQIISDNALENAVRAFLNNEAVHTRLRLFKRLARLERRLASLDGPE